jgi:xanthine dehydrogenase accessory factor
VEWVNAADLTWKATLEGITSAAALHKKAWLLTALPAGASSDKNAPTPTSLSHVVVQRDGNILGVLPSEIPVETVFEILQPEVLTTAGQHWMAEPLETGGAVYIFGAGHVGRSLASFTQAVGFWTAVLDDRPEYANAQHFPTADEIIVLDSFEGVFANLPIESDSFIVIVTRGHLNDRAVLTQALKTSAGYIGMIGSRRKCGLIFDELRKIGFSDADFQRVHAPIGLPIRAETPEEIGVSITAEMIQVRAEIFDS